MLRITADEQLRRLVVEGSLSGRWVHTLEESWRAATTANISKQVAVDLTNVTFVDPPGKQLLRRIHAEGGRLLASGMNLALVQEVATAKRR